MTTKENKKPHTNEKLMKSLESATQFQAFLKKFIEQLVNTYPIDFEENIKTIGEKLKTIIDEDMSKYKDRNQLKKSETFSFIIKFLHSLIEIKEDIHKGNVDIMTTSIFPNDLFQEIPIDLPQLIDVNKIEGNERKTIFVHVALLMKTAENASKVYELSVRERKNQKVRKVYRNHMREKMREYIYDVLGPDGRNESMEAVVESILDELEKKRTAIERGQMGPNEIKDMVMKLYNKFKKKHEEGEINVEDMYTSTKILIKNLMNNKDLNLKDGFKDILNNMNMEGVPKDMMQNMMDDLSNMDDNTTPEMFEEKMKKYANQGINVESVLENLKSASKNK